MGRRKEKEGKRRKEGKKICRLVELVAIRLFKLFKWLLLQCECNMDALLLASPTLHLVLTTTVTARVNRRLGRAA